MWLIIGLILGAGIAVLAIWLRSKAVRVAWYEWLIAALGILLIMFSIENARASYAEFETVAALKSILIFGLPGLLLILLVVALVFWRFVRHGRKTGQA
jgi:ribose/xylose/arabinose/galactoside ABC-type transport system permease subunit